MRIYDDVWKKNLSKRAIFLFNLDYGGKVFHRVRDNSHISTTITTTTTTQQQLVSLYVHRSIYRSIVFHVSSPRYCRYFESPPPLFLYHASIHPLTDPPLSLFITSAREYTILPQIGGLHRFRKFYAKPVPISLDIRREIIEWDRMRTRKGMEAGRGAGDEDLRASFSPSPRICIEHSRITVASVSRRVKRSETIDRFTADSLLSLSVSLHSSVNFDRPRWINFRRSGLCAPFISNFPPTLRQRRTRIDQFIEFRLHLRWDSLSWWIRNNFILFIFHSFEFN